LDRSVRAVRSPRPHSVPRVAAGPRLPPTGNCLHFPVPPPAPAAAASVSPRPPPPAPPSTPGHGKAAAACGTRPSTRMWRPPAPRDARPCGVRQPPTPTSMTTRTVRNHCTHGRVDTAIAWAVPARRNAPVQEKVFFSMVFACPCATAVWPPKIARWIRSIPNNYDSCCFICYNSFSNLQFLPFSKASSWM
ncbi:unnamed protein product, partial [Urochloa humidicola]